jgi:DNA-directed RNA polymerase subunit RPC12/RpoP
MKRVCAWCGKELGEVPGGENTQEISHGICEACEKKMREELEEIKKEKKANIEEKPMENKFPIK